MLSNWVIEVVFTGEYEDMFDKDQQTERKDSEHRFKLSIEQVIKETGTIPVVGDWIQPLFKEDYVLDIGEIGGRNFFPKIKKIQFEIK